MFIHNNLATLTEQSSFSKYCDNFSKKQLFAMILATPKDRIMCYLDYKKISKQNFFNQTGIKRGFLDKDKMQQVVSTDHLAKIVATYSDVSLYWIVTGKGDMILRTEETYTSQDASAIANIISELKDNVIGQSRSIIEQCDKVLSIANELCDIKKISR